MDKVFIPSASGDQRTHNRQAAQALNTLSTTVVDLTPASRTDLAGITAYDGQRAIFDGSTWEFDDSNLSAEVTADTAQGVYVAPSSDATGASGAWVRKFSGPVPGAAFGVTGDGTTDDTAAINAALNFAVQNGNGFVQLPHGATCLIGTSAQLVIPANGFLDLNGSTLLGANVDRDFIQLGQHSWIMNGTLDLSDLTTFTSSAITIPSTTTPWLALGSRVLDMTIYGVNPGATNAPTGTAVEFAIAATDQHRVSFSGITNCHIQYFHTGVACDIPDYPSSATSAALANYASSNRVDGGCTFYDVVDAVRGTKVSTDSGLGQWAMDYTAQVRTSKSTFRRLLEWEGSVARIDISCWDAFGHTVDTMLVEFTDLSERNEARIGGVTDEQVINRCVLGRPNEVRTYGSTVGYTQSRSTAPMTLPLPVCSGRQDDYLAHAGTRSGWTLTVTDGGGTPVAVSSGATSNVFDGNPNNFARYTGYNGTLIWTLDMGASVSRPQLLGVAFSNGDQPDTLKIESSTDAAAWTTLYEKAAVGSVGPVEQWHTRGNQGAARYIRWTFVNNSASDIIIYGLWGMFAGAAPNAFLSKYQPNAESQLSVDGTKVLGPRVTGWTADTGTNKRTANATYSGTAEAAYTQATIQTLMDAVRDLSQTMKALKADLTTHGIIGT